MPVITAESLPLDRVKENTDYQKVDGVWTYKGKICCTFPDKTQYMTVTPGGLFRTSMPPICGRVAVIQMTKSKRYFCGFHAPKKGARTLLNEAPNGD